MEITDKHIEQFLAAAHQTGERRLTRCSSGNLSWRIGEFALISATGSWLPELQAGQISICRVATGEITNGIHPSMESGFHLQILQNRPDVNVVLHRQSIYATTIACMKKKPDNFNVSIEIPCYCGERNSHRPLLSSRFGRISEGCQRSPAQSRCCTSGKTRTSIRRKRFEKYD